MERADNYVFDAEGIERIHIKSKEMEDDLKSSYNQSKEFFLFMQETDLWVGQLKEEFLAYYHLVLQYHGWLIGEVAPSVGDVSVISPAKNCCGEINDSLKKLLEEMGSFENNSEQYSSIKEISG